MIEKFLCLFLFWHLSAAFHNGAPCSTQHSLTPSSIFHGNPQNPASRPPPYKFQILDSDGNPVTKYAKNHVYTIKLTGEQASFRGFVIQARPASAEGHPIGHLRAGVFLNSGKSWQSQGIKVQPCPGVFNDSLTHATNDDRNSLEVQWKPTKNYGPILFILTVVQNRTMFWTQWTPQSGLIQPEEGAVKEAKAPKAAAGKGKGKAKEADEEDEEITTSAPEEETTESVVETTEVEETTPAATKAPKRKGKGKGKNKSKTTTQAPIETTEAETTDEAPETEPPAKVPPSKQSVAAASPDRLPPAPAAGAGGSVEESDGSGDEKKPKGGQSGSKKGKKGKEAEEAEVTAEPKPTGGKEPKQRPDDKLPVAPAAPVGDEDVAEGGDKKGIQKPSESGSESQAPKEKERLRPGQIPSPSDESAGHGQLSAAPKSPEQSGEFPPVPKAVSPALPVGGKPLEGLPQVTDGPADIGGKSRLQPPLPAAGGLEPKGEKPEITDKPLLGLGSTQLPLPAAGSASKESKEGESSGPQPPQPGQAVASPDGAGPKPHSSEDPSGMLPSQPASSFPGSAPQSKLPPAASARGEIDPPNRPDRPESPEGQPEIPEDIDEAVDYCAEKPCINNGTCVNIPEEERYECKCPSKFAGSKCQYENQCLKHSCKNGAQCISGENTYTCKCAKEWGGDTCDKPCPAYLCENGGTCIISNDQYGCICATGYTGTRCHDEVKHCDSNPCHNGATCVHKFNSFECRCQDGYMGENCHRPCQDIYKSCDFWGEQEKCENERPNTRWFDINCAHTCGQCKRDNRTIQVENSLPPVLEPFEFLMGRWIVNSTDHRRFPLDFEHNNTNGYIEELVFSVASVPQFGPPSINVSAKAVNQNNPSDIMITVGFLTVRPATIPLKTFLMTTGNDGITVIEDGFMNNTVIQLNSTYFAIHPWVDDNAPAVAKRTFSIANQYLKEDVERTSNNGHKDYFTKYYWKQESFPIF